MLVYVLRHGKAARQDPEGPPSLTAGGREEVNRVAEHFRGKKLKINTLWHSPKTRAVQTAEIVLKTLADPSIEVEEKKGLEPEGDAEEIFEEINRFKDVSLMLVSHLPLVGDLASRLAGNSPHPLLVFPTAGLVAFERTGKTWKWLWALDPSELD